jgi:hypothetical protein
MCTAPGSLDTRSRHWGRLHVCHFQQNSSCRFVRGLVSLDVESVDWPRFLHPEADEPRPNSFGGAMRCRFRGANFAQNKKRRPFGEDRRLKCSSCSRLPSDHPPCGTPVPEGTLFVSECLYHKPPASATNSARFALGSPGQDQGPPGTPVEGCADTAPTLSSPDRVGVRFAWQRGGRMAPRRWSPRDHHGAASGDDGKGNGGNAYSIGIERRISS